MRTPQLLVLSLALALTTSGCAELAVCGNVCAGLVAVAILVGTLSLSATPGKPAR